MLLGLSIPGHSERPFSIQLERSFLNEPLPFSGKQPIARGKVRISLLERSLRCLCGEPIELRRLLQIFADATHVPLPPAISQDARTKNADLIMQKGTSHVPEARKGQAAPGP